MASKPIFYLVGIGTSGFLFGAGLVLSGMTQPSKVLGFLDIAAMTTGTWDPTLAFVLGGAVVTTFIGYRLVWRCKRPIFATSFQLPKVTALDMPLLGGAALFGIGWGLAGYCPGPALASLVNPTLHTLAFTAAMIGGMASGKLFNNRKKKS
ncbi:MAG: hypothetical protein COY40_03840 [Alphaproteobacteria bacterium CG_4_10_14_0_8_um_filter_53_9]|nr:MAG: hypothetical protein COY40_03840 [Alphaproteobacteria bacterium CG_4_10_14_0_8_um_filter_53_9]